MKRGILNMKKGLSVAGVILPFAGALGIAATDLFFKNKVDKELDESENKEIKKGIFLIRKHHNRGAMFNLAQKYPQEVTGVSVFSTVLNFLALATIAPKRGRVLEKAGFSLMLGGAISNTYDRVKKKYVMDYVSLDVKPEKVRNIVFNISDVSLLLGVILVFISNLTAKDRAL